MKFAIPEEATPSGEGTRPGSSLERRPLSTERARPTAQTPPAAPPDVPKPVAEASERSAGVDPAAAASPRERTRRGASSWWHAALAGGALAAIMSVFAAAPLA